MPRYSAGNQVELWPKVEMAELAQALGEKVKAETATWLDRRNAAYIALLATFGKRVSELCPLRLRDVNYDDYFVYARFYVLKESSPARVPCACGAINRASWKYCKSCGQSLDGRPVIQRSVKHEPQQLMRTRKHPLADFVVRWLDFAKSANPGNDEAFLFPPCKMPEMLFGQLLPNWQAHIGRRMALIVVKSVLPSGWNHLFRSTLATKFSEAGYDEIHLMDWFGWHKYETAHRYIRLGGGKRIRDMGSIVT